LHHRDQLGRYAGLTNRNQRHVWGQQPGNRLIQSVGNQLDLPNDERSMPHGNNRTLLHHDGRSMPHDNEN
jgi:hypothetical protein